MKPHPTAVIHPYVTRLFVDCDPAGNPIGRGCVVFERGAEQATIWFDHPAPFDTISEAWADLTTEYVDRFGTQDSLF